MAPVWDKNKLLAEICAGYGAEMQRQRRLLEHYRLERAELVLAAEGRQARGEEQAANELKPRLNDLEHKIRASERLLAKLQRLRATFQAQLWQVRPPKG